MPNETNGKKNGKNSGDKSMCNGCMVKTEHCGCSQLVLAHFLFGLGLLSLLFAWIASSSGQPVLGFPAQHLFNDAIAFMVAGVFFRKKF